MSLKKTALALSLVLGFSVTAQAQELDDRWEISAAYFQPDLELSARGSGSATDGTDTVLGAGSGKLDGDFRGGQVEATWKPTQRQRVVAGWYRVSGDQGFDVARTGVYSPNATDSYDYDLNAQGNLDTRFELYRLSYGFDVFQGEHTTVTALAGVYGAKIKSRAVTSGTLVVDADTYDLASVSRVSEIRYAPGFGLAAEWRPTDKWNVRASAQGFKTNWGDFNIHDGHFVHAQAQVGYRFARHWTGFVGYDYFDLKLGDDLDGSYTYEGVDYSGIGTASARLKIHGPTVGVRASF